MKTITLQDLNKAFTARVLRNDLITPLESDEDIHEITLELSENKKEFQIGQSLGLLIEGPHEFGNPYHFRLYSIVEHNTDRQQDTVKLLVKRCFYLDDVNGQQFKGIASNYLCDRRVGDQVSLLGPYSRPFSIPEDATANIVMIGMGTGIAPFRAFIRYIYRTRGKWLGKVRLFYGARTGLEMLYMNDRKSDIAQYYDEETFEAIQSVSKQRYGEVSAASVADSIVDSLKKNADEVWSMIRTPGSHLYVAGLEVMEEKLQRVFTDLAGSEGQWNQIKEKMVRENRYQDIIY